MFTTIFLYYYFFSFFLSFFPLLFVSLWVVTNSIYLSLFSFFTLLLLSFVTLNSVHSAGLDAHGEQKSTSVREISYFTRVLPVKRVENTVFWFSSRYREGKLTYLLIFISSYLYMKSLEFMFFFFPLFFFFFLLFFSFLFELK